MGPTPSNDISKGRIGRTEDVDFDDRVRLRLFSQHDRVRLQYSPAAQVCSLSHDTTKTTSNKKFKTMFIHDVAFPPSRTNHKKLNRSFLHQFRLLLSPQLVCATNRRTLRHHLLVRWEPRSIMGNIYSLPSTIFSSQRLPPPDALQTCSWCIPLPQIVPFPIECRVQEFVFFKKAADIEEAIARELVVARAGKFPAPLLQRGCILGDHEGVHHKSTCFHLTSYEKYVEENVGWFVGTGCFCIEGGSFSRRCPPIWTSIISASSFCEKGRECCVFQFDRVHQGLVVRKGARRENKTRTRVNKSFKFTMFVLLEWLFATIFKH